MSDSLPTPDSPRRPFLTARWESLVLLNYACPEGLLAPWVPRGTELDPWEGEYVASMVGFRFVDTRVRGVRVPGHHTFDEVNLRFYVRHTTAEGEVRRGVVFVRELVPLKAVAWGARLLYNEPYRAVPMWHEVALDPERGGRAAYGWRWKGRDFALRAAVEGPAAPLQPGSEAEFITEHYWGYTRQRDGGTKEYRVDHPRWRVWSATESAFEWPNAEGGGASLYGPGFDEVLQGAPRSAFVAVGSEAAVYPGVRLRGG